MYLLDDWFLKKIFFEKPFTFFQKAFIIDLYREKILEDF
jgi:hypothetical protein